MPSIEILRPMQLCERLHIQQFSKRKQLKPSTRRLNPKSSGLFTGFCTKPHRWNIEWKEQEKIRTKRFTGSRDKCSQKKVVNQKATAAKDQK